MNISDLLRTGWTGTSLSPLSEMDIAFAHMLQSLAPSQDPRHLWLAALVSHQWGRGHACLTSPLNMADAADQLAWPTSALQAIPTDVWQALPTLPWTQGDDSPLVLDGSRLYLRRAWRAEQRIRQCLQMLQQQQFVPAPQLAQQLDALFETNLANDQQRQACAHAASHALTLITGGPGTGKTTTVVKLLRLLQASAESPLKTILTAPTGKAAARLAQAMAQARQTLPEALAACLPTQAHTLHKLLQTSHQQPTASLQADVVVVDEASMIDLELMARLLQAVPRQARLVLLGDKDQLASVEAGAVMAQLCQAPWLAQNTIALSYSHRFDAHQGIGQWAKAANAGDIPALQQLWTEAPEGCLPHGSTVSRLSARQSHHPTSYQHIRSAWAEWLSLLSPHQQGHAASDAQALALLNSFAKLGVLCALREGPWGVNAFNAHIQKALGFADAPWFVGRPVMARRNDYALGLMNGDTGLCLPQLVGTEHRLRVAFADGLGGVKWQVPSRLAAVDTAFAITVHQSQGCEFEQVLLVLPDTPAPLLTRELIYTGMTRARQRLCVWAPEPDLLSQACSRTVRRSGGLSVAKSEP